MMEDVVVPQLLQFVYVETFRFDAVAGGADGIAVSGCVPYISSYAGGYALCLRRSCLCLSLARHLKYAPMPNMASIITKM